MKIPKYDAGEKEECQIIVTFLEAGTNVAVWGDKVLNGKTISGKATVIDCVEPANTLAVIYIYTDADVSVNVFFKILSRHRGFPVFTVDASGTEFHIGFKVNANCYPVSVHKNVSGILSYTLIASQNINTDKLYSGHRFDVKKDTFIGTNAYATREAFIKFDKPTTLFCEYRGNIGRQILPLTSWSTHYLVPANISEYVAKTFTLVITASADNTHVSIGSISSSVEVVLAKRGDTHEFILNSTNNQATVRITATSPVSVGLEMSDSMHTFPPVSGFIENGIFTSIAKTAIEGWFNASTIDSFIVRNSGLSTKTIVNLQDISDFYQHWEQGLPSYGFTFVQTETGEGILMPGYMQVSRQFTVNLIFSAVLLHSVMNGSVSLCVSIQHCRH